MHDELRGLLESKGYSLQTHGDQIVHCSAAVSHSHSLDCVWLCISFFKSDSLNYYLERHLYKFRQT
jgi:hypothetical protein